jgi:hypothetical protein
LQVGYLGGHGGRQVYQVGVWLFNNRYQYPFVAIGVYFGIFYTGVYLDLGNIFQLDNPLAVVAYNQVLQLLAFVFTLASVTVRYSIL